MINAVITTIQQPTECVRSLVVKMSENGGTLYVIGDKKGPPDYQLDQHENCRIEFLPLQEQMDSGLKLAESLPTGHYARKNIGYLSAIRNAADCIYETDDDNAPNASWGERSEKVDIARIVPAPADPRWVNVYKYFTDANIWPRGLPLDEIHHQLPATSQSQNPVRSPIQQGLVDGSPDVDAIWRLVLDREFQFEKGQSVYLEPGNFCPFNTQSTWWWPVAYPLLYIPSYCSFRMCDIWKSFIAQRCLWELNCGVTFHAPEVVQDRNLHNLMHDFEDEVPGYLKNSGISKLLSDVTLKPGSDSVGDNLLSCYEMLVSNEIFPQQELKLVSDWIQDLKDSG